MKIKELIEELQKYGEETEILVWRYDKEKTYYIPVSFEKENIMHQNNAIIFD